MEKNYKLVIDLVYASMYKKNLNLTESVSDKVWEEAVKILDKNKLLGVTYRTVNSLSDEKKPNKEIMARWKNKAFFIGMIQTEKKVCICKLLKEAEKKGIKLVVFKGIPLAELYPEPLMRYSCDTDIFVYDKDSAEQLLVEQGFVHDGGKENVPDYIKDNRVKIELHTRLWEDYENSQTKYLDSLDITDVKSLVCENYNGEKLYTLGYNEHLIFQMFHIIKHFSLEGVGIKYLVDLSLYINKHIDIINKEYFWKIMKDLHYDIFCDAFFKLAVTYFGMNKDILNEEYSSRKYDESLLDDIFMVGKLSDEDDLSWKVMHLLMPYYLQEREVPKTRWQRLRFVVFPKAEELTDYYSYAKRNRLLLPIAWMHRILNRFMVDKKKVRDDEDTISKTKKVEHRLKLLNDMKLTN